MLLVWQAALPNPHSWKEPPAHLSAPRPGPALRLLSPCERSGSQDLEDCLEKMGLLKKFSRRTMVLEYAVGGAGRGGAGRGGAGGGCWHWLCLQEPVVLGARV